MNKEDKVKKTNSDLIVGKNEENKNFTSINEEVEKNKNAKDKHNKGNIRDVIPKNLASNNASNEKIQNKNDKPQIKNNHTEDKKNNDKINTITKETANKSEILINGNHDVNLNWSLNKNYNVNNTSDPKTKSYSNHTSTLIINSNVNLTNFIKGAETKSGNEKNNNRNKHEINSTLTVGKHNTDDKSITKAERNVSDRINHTYTHFESKEDNESDMQSDFNSTNSIDNFMLSTNSAMNMTIDDEFVNNNVTENQIGESETFSGDQINTTSSSEIIVSTVKFSDSEERNKSNSNLLTSRDDNKSKSAYDMSEIKSKGNITSIINKRENSTKKTLINIRDSNKNFTQNSLPINMSSVSAHQSSTENIDKNQMITINTLDNPLLTKKNDTYIKKTTSEEESIFTESPTIIQANREDTLLLDQEKKIQATLAKRTQEHSSHRKYHKTSNNTKNNSAYENLRKRKEEFDEIEKSNENQEKKPKKQKESDSVEYKVYKRIIEISVSLIVIGLFMGILLGIIIVTYFNSKK